MCKCSLITNTAGKFPVEANWKFRERDVNGYFLFSGFPEPLGVVVVVSYLFLLCCMQCPEIWDSPGARTPLTKTRGVRAPF